MKKIQRWGMLFIFHLLTVFISCNSTSGTRQSSDQSGSYSSIDAALQDIAKRVEERLPRGTRLAIVNVSSPSEIFSDYAIEELTMFIQENSNLVVVDRNALHYALVQAEIDFQLSGNVSDETQAIIGHMLGAQSILSASLLDVGDAYRFRAAVIQVETLVRQATAAQDINKDRRLEFLLTTESVEKRTSTANPATAFDYRRRGIEYLEDRRNYEMAVADFTQAIRLNPQDVDAYFFRSIAYHRLGRYTESIDDCNEVLFMNPQYRAVYNNRGAAYADRAKKNGNNEDYKNALDDLFLALEINTGSSNINFNIGSVYFDLGDYSKAIQYLNRSIEINRQNALAYNERANVYHKLGNRQETLRNLEMAAFYAPYSAALKAKYELYRDKNEWVDDDQFEFVH